MEFFGHVIDGAEVKSSGGETFTSVDPYTREPWAEVALGGAAEVERAVAPYCAVAAAQASAPRSSSTMAPRSAMTTTALPMPPGPSS
ncbi:hypothetical protein ABZ260_18805, partial [Streptosporangium sp. NPDC006013]